MKKYFVLIMFFTILFFTLSLFTLNTYATDAGILLELKQLYPEADSELTDIINRYLSDNFNRNNTITEEKIDDMKDLLENSLNDNGRQVLGELGIEVHEVTSVLDSIKTWSEEERTNFAKAIVNNDVEIFVKIAEDNNLVETLEKTNNIFKKIEEGVAETPNSKDNSSDDDDEDSDKSYNDETPIDAIESTVTFKDIENHWAKSSIIKMTNANIISGMNRYTFGPNELVTRSQMTTMIVKLLNIEPIENESISFSDVKKGSWYYGFVASAFNNGLVNGFSKDTFAPDANITREQMVVIIMNAMKFSDIDVDISSYSDLEFFKDMDLISHWALEDMKKAHKLGLISGKGNNILDPKGTATRAEAVTVLEKLYNIFYLQ